MGITLIPAIDISSSALEAERTRLEISANNLANVNTTRTPEGGPYRRRIPVFTSIMKEETDSSEHFAGVKVEEVITDSRPPLEVYAPFHPDANAEGMGKMPAVSPIEEMVDITAATRAYEANLAVIKEIPKRTKAKNTPARAKLAASAKITAINGRITIKENLFL